MKKKERAPVFSCRFMHAMINVIKEKYNNILLKITVMLFLTVTDGCY